MAAFCKQNMGRPYRGWQRDSFPTWRAGAGWVAIGRETDLNSIKGNWDLALVFRTLQGQAARQGNRWAGVRLEPQKPH